MLLAIDTSAGTSVAVVMDEGVGADAVASVVAHRSVEDTRRHAEVIGELILQCIEESGSSVSELSGVAIGMGPGPFTGLRVGIAAAAAFAFGAGIDLLRVSSHDAIAFEHYLSGGAGALLVTTDARRHERYWSAFRGPLDFGIPEPVGGPGLAPPEDLAQEVTDYGSYRRLDTNWVSAASVGQLAASLRRAGGEFASEQPLYVRPPDAKPAVSQKRVSA